MGFRFDKGDGMTSRPIDVIRSVQPGTPPGGDYSFILEQRGDVDTPPASPFP